jgi:hypothetical protein
VLDRIGFCCGDLSGRFPRHAGKPGSQSAGRTIALRETWQYLRGSTGRKVEITNGINAFLPDSRRASEISFCVKIAQRRAFYRSCWSPNEKTSAKCILCISYTRAENGSVKLPGMTELAAIQLARLARLCRFACG